MSSPTPTLDPIRNSNLWHKFQLKGVNSPGTIAKGGHKGFKRATGWDEKKGKGTQGATLTLTSQPPAKGTFVLQLFTPQDFADWDTFVSQVLSIDPKQQQAAGLAIYHPALSSIGLTTVVVAHYTAPEHMGKGMYHVEIDLIEWSQPPPVNVTSTATTTAPDTTDPTTPVQDTPEIAALKAQLVLLNQAANAP